MTLPRLPLIPTLIVGICVAAMIALGVWQLQRRGEKEAALIRYAQNFDKPSMDFPRIPVGEVFVPEKVSPENLRWNRRASDRARALAALTNVSRAAPPADRQGAG